MNMKFPVVFFVAATLIVSVNCKKKTETKAEAPNVYIISPTDGDTVKSPFTVQFGLTGMGIAPAGTDKTNTGHHHLLIDVTEMPDMTMPLPANDHIKHFGKGQTQTTLDLKQGTHTLQLVMGDKDHIPHNPPVISRKITITVEK